MNFSTLPWKLRLSNSNMWEEAPDHTAEIVQRMTERRTFNNDEQTQESVHTILARLEADLKGRLTEMDRKLDRILAPVSSSHLSPAPIARLSGRSSLRRSATSTSSSVARMTNHNFWMGGADERSDWERSVSAPATPPPQKLNVELAQPHGSPAWLHLPVDYGHAASWSIRKDSSDSYAPRASKESSMPSLHTQTLHIRSMIRQKMDGHHRKRSQLAQEIWKLLEDPESSGWALWFSRLMVVLVVVNVAFSLLQTQGEPLLQGSLPIVLQLVFDILCLFEFLLRFRVSPNRCKFFLSFFNWVDFLAGMIVVLRSLRLGLGQSAGRELDDILLCVTPVVWLLKLLRNFEKFHLLCSAFMIAFEALPVLLFTLTILVLSFAAAIFLIEPRENFSELPRAVWFTIVTMMTVGYGDITPQSSAGHILVSVLMIGSQLYMAIPLGIVGGSFSRVWEDRDRLLLIRRTRYRLIQWGYTPQFLLQLFFYYDTQRTGELDIQDFTRMMSDLDVALDAERVHRLFRSLDVDSSGKIDHEEFVSAIYPGQPMFSPRSSRQSVRTSRQSVSPTEASKDTCIVRPGDEETATMSRDS